jgi:hypothetical protein
MLMDDIDCFAKEWSEMFDELSAGVNGPEGRPSKLDSFTRMRPIAELESTGTCQADGLAMEKQMHKFFVGSTVGFGRIGQHPASVTSGEYRW